MQDIQELKVLLWGCNSSWMLIWWTSKGKVNVPPPPPSPPTGPRGSQSSGVVLEGAGAGRFRTGVVQSPCPESGRPAGGLEGRFEVRHCMGHTWFGLQRPYPIHTDTTPSLSKRLRAGTRMSC